MDPSQQVITISNERFMVPEALFHPSDIGIRQAGIAKTTGRCLQSFAPGLRTLLRNNIGPYRRQYKDSRIFRSFFISYQIDHEMISLMTTQDVTPYMDEGKPYHIYQTDE